MADISEQHADESIDDRAIGSVLVIGAGVAGIRAALDLAEVGYRVVLTDASPAIGGILAKLDYQFPSDHCGMCKMLPVVGREYASQYCMRKSLFHDNIKIMPFTDVVRVTGQPGAFEVELRQHARHVDTDVCIGTGYCAEVCPIEVPDEFNNGLTRRKAVYQPVPHNLPNMYLIDMNACDKCGECVKVCPVDAIELEATSEPLSIQVDGIVLATGSGLYDPADASDLSSYALSPDVVTALEFERLLSSSGAYDNTIRRPSDGRPAKRIAWLQCVGSRNRRQERDFCSSICCMFALKEAVLAHTKGGPDIETSIFYMDMRTFGKDFYRYREHAEEQYGVRLVRCRVHNVDLLPNGKLRLRYRSTKTEQWEHETFDIVVLSTGQSPQAGTRKLAELFGIHLPATGFFPANNIDKTKTPQDGVFMCGSFCGLTDIAESLTSGSAAASEASKLLSALDRPFKEQASLPPEKPVERERPNIHILLCRWNYGKMPEGIDLEPLQTELERRLGVGQVDIIETLCRGDGFEQAKQILASSPCNRVLFGACLPYIYRQRLKLLAQTAGFNPSLVEVVDIRSTIQRYLAEEDIPTLIGKVSNQLFLAVEKLKAADSLSIHSIDVTQRALVVGAGVAGMRAALSLADRGVEVILVEKRDELGGRPLKRMYYTLEGIDPISLVANMQQAVWENKRISVYKNSQIVSNVGSLGHFETVLRNGDEDDATIHHGATIIATGGQEATTTEYCCADSDRILTQSEVEDHLANHRFEPSALDTEVMIQCVGSREKGAHEYCSRICCSAALKNAFKIRELNPAARIIVLYRDMMTYGSLEQYYTKARREGILFAPYELDDKPKVEQVDGKPKITFNDPILNQPMQVSADLLCLSTGIAAEESNVQLAEIFGVELTQDGFFQEAESKWRPVDFLKEGVFLAGAAHSPRPISEVIAQAEAAAQRAFSYLSKRQITTARVISRVHDSLCSRCRACVTICPFDARAFDDTEQRIVVDEAACQGCGMCAMACPNSAAEVMGVNERQAFAQIDAALEDIWSTASS